MIGVLNPIQFSVIIPLYNKEKSISSTIESVLNQTYPQFELIIINDGSTDSGLKIVQSYTDSRIRIFNKVNGGVSSARNRGIEKSQNQYIVFLDADDLWLPYCLEEFKVLINEFSSADVFCSNYNMTGKKLKGSEKRYLIEDCFKASAFYLAKWSIPIMITGCVTVKKHVFKEVGNFNQNITHGEDLDMWERLAAKYTIAKSERITTIYRTDSENRASNIAENLKVKYIPNEINREGSLSNSQKTYYGVQLILSLWSLLKNGQFYIVFRKLTLFMDYGLRGLYCILKARLFGYHLFP